MRQKRTSRTPSLTGEGTSGITEGGFLSSGGGTTNLEVVDNGDGSYEIDNATFGSPCGTDATSGTLFNLAVSSATAGGTGTVVIDVTEYQPQAVVAGLIVRAGAFDGCVVLGDVQVDRPRP